MKNVFYKENWLLVGIQAHIGTPPIPLIKCDSESNEPKAGFIKVKLRINPTSATSDI